MTNEQIKKLQSENYTLKKFIGLKDEEIKRQVKAKQFAQQTRNWAIILVILIHLAIWLF